MARAKKSAALSLQSWHHQCGAPIEGSTDRKATFFEMMEQADTMMQGWNLSHFTHCIMLHTSGWTCTMPDHQNEGNWGCVHDPPRTRKARRSL